MLNDEIIEKVIEKLVNRIEQANLYLLKEIGKSVKEIGTLTPTKAHELAQILKYGGNIDKVIKRLSEITQLNVNDIYKIFEETAKSDYRFAKQFYEYRQLKYIPYENTYLKQQVDAIARLTVNEYINLTKTTALGFCIETKDGIVFKGIKETYYELIDEAVLNISQGKETFDNAMYKRLKEINSSGVKVIYPTTYIDKNGNIKHHTRRLDSAVKMNLRSGIRGIHNETQQIIGEEINSDGIEISVHLNPAPDHQYAQGKQFENKEYSKLQSTGSARTYDNEFIDIHTGNNFRPISELNCYHYVFSIVLGVNKPQYTKEELKEIINDNNKGFDLGGNHYTMYEGTQLQRQLETEIRKAKDEQILAKESGNTLLIADSQKRITMLTRKYRELINASNLPNELRRARVSGYRRTAVVKK